MERKCSNMSRVQVYLTRLLPALQKIHKGRSSLTQRQRAIRRIADICLAQTAKNGSPWSRALNLHLLPREKMMATLKMKKSSLRRSRSVTLARRTRMPSLSSRCCTHIDIKTDSHDDGSIDRKLGTLQRLVAGGRSMGFDTLLQETPDYIILKCKFTPWRPSQNFTRVLLVYGRSHHATAAGIRDQLPLL